MRLFEGFGSLLESRRAGPRAGRDYPAVSRVGGKWTVLSAYHLTNGIREELNMIVNGKCGARALIAAVALVLTACGPGMPTPDEAHAIAKEGIVNLMWPG